MRSVSDCRGSRSTVSELSVLCAAEEVPERLCLVWADGELTYADVAERVRAVIARAEEQRLDPTKPVAIIPSVSVDSVVRILALMERGVPIALVHPRTSASERDAAVERTRSFSVHGTGPDRCLAILHTSGTSAVAKPVVLSRRAFSASARASAENLGWQEDDRWLLSMPPAHVGGLSVLTRALIARRTVVLGAAQGFDPVEIAALIEKKRVTLASLVPTMLLRLLDTVPDWRAPSSLRAVLVGGAPLSPSLRARAIERGMPVLTTYGCTETCSQVATQAPTNQGTDDVGWPLRDVELRLRDGVIEVRGPTLADGYLEHGQLIPLASDGWFRTGDLGEFTSDGRLRVLGRGDEMIVTGGENVSPVAVEMVLEGIQGIDAACVFGLPDEQWGQRVVAALVCGPDFDSDRLRTEIQANLSDHARPKAICIVKQLPLTSLGKRDRSRAAVELLSAMTPI